MAGKHVGGSDTLAVARGDTAPFVEHFMPKNDKSYAEGRAGARAGLLQTDNPHGANEAAAALINQVEAWLSWDGAWTTIDAPFLGFQEETATVD